MDLYGIVLRGVLFCLKKITYEQVMKFIANVSWFNVTFGTYTGVPENPFSTASFYRQPVISAAEFSKYNFSIRGKEIKKFSKVKVVLVQEF